MNNQDDSFRAPNSMHVNVGNQMTILGAGGDAYVGNRDDGTVAGCFEDALSQRAADKIVILPNPVAGNAFSFALTNHNATATAGSIWLYDMAGRALYFKDYTFEPGLNQQEIAIEDFPVGVYQLAVFGLGKEPMRETVVKGDF